MICTIRIEGFRCIVWRPFLFICAISVLLLSACIEAAPSVPDVAAAVQYEDLSTEQLSRIQAGDIVLRRGRGATSHFISLFLSESRGLTHCALVVNPSSAPSSIPADRISFLAQDGEFFSEPLAVIQSINAQLSGVDGLQLERFSRFLTKTVPQSTLIVRPRMSVEERSLFLDEAWRLFYSKPSFDNEYNLDSEAELYCSEFVYLLFKRCAWEGYDSKIMERKIISFMSFCNSDYFDIIIDTGNLVTK